MTVVEVEIVAGEETTAAGTGFLEGLHQTVMIVVVDTTEIEAMTSVVVDVTTLGDVVATGLPGAIGVVLLVDTEEVHQEEDTEEIHHAATVVEVGMPAEAALGPVLLLVANTIVDHREAPLDVMDTITAKGVEDMILPLADVRALTIIAMALGVDAVLKEMSIVVAVMIEVIAHDFVSCQSKTVSF